MLRLETAPGTSPAPQASPELTDQGQLIQMRQVLKLMNHNDLKENWKAEIGLFDRQIARLKELFLAGGDLNAVTGWEGNKMNSEEGGKPELIEKQA